MSNRFVTTQLVSVVMGSLALAGRAGLAGGDAKGLQRDGLVNAEGRIPIDVGTESTSSPIEHGKVALESAGTCGFEWSALGSGMDSTVAALAVFDDGKGKTLLYAGGAFTTAGGVSANRIAKWDGSDWSALGSGTHDTVEALTVFNDGNGEDLYVGGRFAFSPGFHIAQWNGSAWSTVGSVNDSVLALAVFDDGTGEALYAGGEFTKAGGVTVNHVAKWNGSAWSALGSGMDNNVRALAVFNDGSGPALYAGGNFTSAGGVTANRIAKWDGSDWSALGSGMGVHSSPAVFTMAVFDDGGGTALFVGGLFGAAGGVTAEDIAKWDGENWSALGGGLNNIVFALSVFDDSMGAHLYAGGFFGHSGAQVFFNRIAKWDGSNWSAVGTGVNNVVVALAVFDDGEGEDLYAGGAFTRSGVASVSRIARWACTAVCVPLDCNDHGTCVGDSCVCNTGFDGLVCDDCAPDYYVYPNCVFCEATTTCSDHGTCNASGTCVCDLGWTGPACGECAQDYYDYPNCVFCEATTTCSGHGTCSALGTCVCDLGWTGPACDGCAPDYYDYPNCVFCEATTTCSGNGTCSALGTCDCDLGWTGPGCATQLVPTVSQWGVLAMALLVITAGTLILARRRRQGPAVL